jgi:hypothetical protein
MLYIGHFKGYGGETDKVNKEEFKMGPYPLFITSCPEAEVVRRLTAPLTG